ncbi:hypothetical protein OH799_18750 [Nocardia sp. NBC_00881]|uniref:hypothetical protein n=1 Tax=Nocardia sp. NBC_00881 TaxID=2975995 RepID=UPI0038651E56|nr:hypothetical protein OH799_18750 [Nocardia sp. NBC_00881]
MTTQPTRYKRSSQLRILPRSTPEHVRAVATVWEAASLGRRDARIPEGHRTGYRRMNASIPSGRHRTGE